MKISKLNTEEKILNAAYETFLLYGFHGTTLQKIAVKAKINKSAIHYYFRSKEKLYSKCLETLFDLTTEHDFIAPKKVAHTQKIQWFLITEQYNNQNLFKRTLSNLYPNDFELRMFYLEKWIKYVSLYLITI